jgi:lupus La protein
MSEEVAQKIQRQVEFYFSDANLPNDRFLKAEMEKNQGWVKLETIASFQRLKALTTDVETIKDAVKNSVEIQLSEDGALIKRVKDLVEVNLNPQTVFMTHFPFTYTQDQVEEFLKEKEIKFSAVRLRTAPAPNGKRSFKGSILIVLDSKQAAEELCKREIDSPFKEGEKFVLKPYEQFEMEGKMKDAERQANKQKEEQARLIKEAEIELSLARFKPTPFETGKLIAVTNMPSDAARETILQLIKPLELEVLFIDYDRGRPSGAVKFATDDIQAICDKLNEQAKSVNAENPQVFTVLTGEAETNEWDVIERAKEERLMAAKNGGGNKRKFGGKKNHFAKRQRR